MPWVSGPLPPRTHQLRIREASWLGKDAILIYEMLISVWKLIKMSYGWWYPILLMWYPSCARFILKYRWRYFLSPSAHNPDPACLMWAKTHETSFTGHLKCSKITQHGSKDYSRRTWVSHGSCARSADPVLFLQIPYSIWKGNKYVSLLLQQNHAQNAD